MNINEIYATLEDKVIELNRLIEEQRQRGKEYKDQLYKNDDYRWDGQAFREMPEADKAAARWHAARVATGKQVYIIDSALRPAIQNSDVPYAKTRSQMYDEFWKMAGIKK